MPMLPNKLAKMRKALGIAITGEVEFEGANFFIIGDPDNNVIELHEPEHS